MAAVTSDILIGSWLNLPAQSLTVTVGATAEVVVLAAGSYYLTDATSSRSLLEAFEDALDAHTMLSGANSIILRNRRAFVEASSSFSLTWPADNLLRDLLGFTGNLSGDSEYIAGAISPLLWSPGRTGVYRSRLDTDGIPLHDTAVGMSAAGVVTATRHNTVREQTLTYRYVRNARTWTTAEVGGEFFAFWDYVLSRAAPFKLYRGVTEDEDATTTMTLGTQTPSTGAYVHTPSQPVRLPFDREFANVEMLHPISIDCVTTTDL